MGSLTVWRHPLPRGVAGLCIGRSDVPLDRRKAKRLAHRIRTWARRGGLPRIVITSPLQRTAAVGRWLAAWGWIHHIDARLIELDFGTWEGQPWDRIGAAAMAAWTQDFGQHAPGGGESVAALLDRCSAFIASCGAAQPSSGEGWCPSGVGYAARSAEGTSGSACAVGHAGWISAARWLEVSNGAAPVADRWPASVAYGQRVEFVTPQASGSLPSRSVEST